MKEEYSMNNTSCPPLHIPPHLVDGYTMGHRVPVRYEYYDGTHSGSGAVVYATQKIDECLAGIAAKKTFYYGETDSWLRQALERFPIRDMSVAVMGSETPVYESTVIHRGGKPTTIDYNRIVSEDPRLTTVTVDEFRRSPRQFDAALSISSFEHDGLGRYGDPLNPDGDLQAMADMRRVVKADGLLFLAVPIGRDALVWNAHRIYGPLRLPKLLSGWNLLAFFPSRLLLSRFQDGAQPVFVLQNCVGDDDRRHRFVKQLSIRLALTRPLVDGLRGIRRIANRRRGRAKPHP
jgi:hypothetical protein